MRTISIGFSIALLVSTASAQDYGAERQWLMENPEAVKALGSMSREEVGQFLQTYQSLSPDEKAKLREHAKDFQALGPAERSWALQNPDAVRQLGALSGEEQKKFLDTYKNLSDAEKQKLMENAGELSKLSPEERAWALDNPDAVRQLGALPSDQQKKFLDTYKNLSPDEKKKLMENSDELGKLSPEERAWALDNPDAVRSLGDVPDDDRDKMIDAYRSVSPETQRMLREGMRGGR